MRGTVDRPNHARVMHSPAALVDGLYWQIKFFPRGNKCSTVSGYVVCSRGKPPPDDEEQESEFKHWESGPDGDISFDAEPKMSVTTKRPPATPSVIPPVKEASDDATEVQTNVKMEGTPDEPPVENLPVQTETAPVESGIVETVETAPVETAPGETEAVAVETVPTCQDQPDYRISAQLGMVIYNPNQTQTATCQSSDHMFCPTNNDWGWSGLAGDWDKMHIRKAGERQALLRNDTIAIDAYIRIIDDPSQSLFWHNSQEEPQWPSKLLAGCFPFGTPPLYHSSAVAGIAALSFISPFREIIQGIDCGGWRNSSGIRPRPFIASLQCALHNMRHLKDTSYVNVHPVIESLMEAGESWSDVVTFWEVFRRAIELELQGEDEYLQKLASIFDVSGQQHPLLKLPVRSSGQVQDALAQVEFPDQSLSQLPGPEFLPLMLQREEFDELSREWKLRYDKMTLDDEITLPFAEKEQYFLYGFIVHVGERNSNRFYSILRPRGPGTKWLAFEDGDGNKVFSYTRKQLETYEGLDGDALKEFSSTRETCYLAMYIRADCIERYLPDSLEDYRVPQWLESEAQKLDGGGEQKQSLNYTDEDMVDIEIYMESSLIGRRGLLDMFNVKHSPGKDAIQKWSLPSTTTFQEVRRKVAESLEIANPMKLKLFTLGYGTLGQHDNARWHVVRLGRPLKCWKGTTRPMCIWVALLTTDKEIEFFGDADVQNSTSKKSRGKTRTPVLPGSPERRPISDASTDSAPNADSSVDQGTLTEASVGIADDNTITDLSASALLQATLDDIESTADESNETDLSASGLLRATVNQGDLHEFPRTASGTVDLSSMHEAILSAEGDDPTATEPRESTDDAPQTDSDPPALLEDVVAGDENDTPQNIASLQPQASTLENVAQAEPALPDQTAGNVTTAQQSSDAADENAEVDEMSLAVTHGHLVEVMEVEQLVAEVVEAQNLAASQHATSPEDDAAILALLAADVAELSAGEEDSSSSSTPTRDSDENQQENSSTSSISETVTPPKKREPIVYGFLQKFDVELQNFVVHGTFFAYRDKPVRQAVLKSLGFDESKKLNIWCRTTATAGRLVVDEDDFRAISFVNGVDIIFGDILSEDKISALRTAGKFWRPFDLSQFLRLQDRKHPEAGTFDHITRSHFGQERYSGPLVHGREHGSNCNIVSSNGQVYQGPLVSNDRCGPNGHMTYQNGDTYDGDWKDNEQDGHGVFVQKRTGNKYEGCFRNGKRWGKGTTTWQVAEEEGNQCQICYDQEIDALFFDCGHVCSCVECAKQCEACPICRRQIRQVVKMYRV